jgi:hypothetical protein
VQSYYLKMNRKLLLLLLLIHFFGYTPAQILRYRLSGNSGFFITEPGGPELRHPQFEALSHPGSSDFKPLFKIGAEAEIIAPVTTDFEVGLEFNYTHLSGHTETAPLYNFFLTRYNPLPVNYKYPHEALIYESTLLSILGTSRLYYFQPGEYLNLFFKAFGGIAFVGTDFTFHNPVYRVEYDVGVLFSQGTLSNEDPKDMVFNGGAGLGATYSVSDKWDIYVDGTASFIHSDIVNGVPNFDYRADQTEETLQRTDSWSLVARVSVGLIYSAIPDRRLNRGNFTKSRKSSKSIFWKRNNSSPFSKRKRR